MLLAVVAGALRNWHIGRGLLPDHARARALVPVNRRVRTGDTAAGNQLSGYLCELPVGQPDPARRVAAVRAAMDVNKAAGPGRGAGAVATLADHLPVGLHRLLTPLARRAAPALCDLVVTTVPIPFRPLSLDGAVLREVYPLVPLAAGHALSIAMATHRDHVHVGIQGQRAPDVTRLAAAFPAALAALTPEYAPGDHHPRVRLPFARARGAPVGVGTPIT
ncbi:WS/DGAT domain-containing protein [Actinokineospora sp. HUAS TT18]|uniref:WS/DGAT domain-containing protein n=1 Tax=Actinokineospora sp. HUAS TT18 TaxID=3447451 RepID=UPI003F520A19